MAESSEQAQRADESASKAKAEPKTAGGGADTDGVSRITADLLEIEMPVPHSIGTTASSSMLFLVAAVCLSAYVFTELVFGKFELNAVYLLLSLSAALSWAAYAMRERGHEEAWAGAVGACVVTTMFWGGEHLATANLLSGILITLTWAGMLLHPQWNTALGLYSVFVLYTVKGLPRTNDDFGIPVVMAFVLVPIALGAALHLRERSVDNQVKASLSKLAKQRQELEQRLQAKMDELELSREQLFEAQKLKTVGTMASGLAHELNNILTPIRGHAELIAEGAASTEQSRRYGQRILDSAAAAAQITGALLTYTRQGTFQPVRSNLRQLLQAQILPVLSRSLPGNVRLKVDLARNVSVDVDRVLLQQAVANLVFNAVDAMPEGGEITISLGTSSRPHAEAEEDKVDVNDGIPRSAVLTVADTGTGIDDEHIDQIFDPFFTTKAVGSGSGLGLAMLMGTVTRHHGRVLVDSVIGEGTTFTILLPLVVAEDRDSSHKPWPVLGGDSNGPVVVVLTEDQDALDEFEELLEATECKPICTSDPKGAAPLLTEMGDKVDLLILDLEIEGSTRMFKSVRELNPDMPVILLSDSPTDPTVQRMIGAGPTRSVRKPMDGRLFSALLTDLLHPSEGYVRDFTPVPIGPGADSSGPHPRA